MGKKESRGSTSLIPLLVVWNFPTNHHRCGEPQAPYASFLASTDKRKKTGRLPRKRPTTRFGNEEGVLRQHHYEGDPRRHHVANQARNRAFETLLGQPS